MLKITSVIAIALFSALTFADNIVPFHIQSGKGEGPWNSLDNPIVVRVGETLRLYNDDTVPHFLHTDGTPCPHGTREFAPGEFYDCVISSVHRAADEDVYDHNYGPDAQLYIEAVP